MPRQHKYYKAKKLKNTCIAQSNTTFAKGYTIILYYLSQQHQITPLQILFATTLKKKSITHHLILKIFYFYLESWTASKYVKSIVESTLGKICRVFTISFAKKFTFLSFIIEKSICPKELNIRFFIRFFIKAFHQVNIFCNFKIFSLWEVLPVDEDGLQYSQPNNGEGILKKWRPSVKPD